LPCFREGVRVFERALRPPVRRGAGQREGRNLGGYGAGSIDPIYYDESYYLAPDAKAGEDVYAVLREAIAKTDTIALTRVVISQRERTVALRNAGPGLIAHTLLEERDLNRAWPVF
jgi:hypothetical protein